MGNGLLSIMSELLSEYCLSNHCCCSFITVFTNYCLVLTVSSDSGNGNAKSVHSRERAHTSQAPTADIFQLFSYFGRKKKG